MFASDAQQFRKQLHETIICQFNVAQNVADLYKERVHTREVERFRAAHKIILSTHWNEFVSTVNTVLMAAATINFEYFYGPFLLSKLKNVTKGAATNTLFTVF